MDKILCGYEGCKRKYARQSKLEQHMEEEHPFACYNSNNFLLSLADKQYLLSQLRNYTSLVREAANFTLDEVVSAIPAYLSWDGVSVTTKQVIFVWTSHMLLPQCYPAYLLTEFMNSKIQRPSELGDWFVKSNNFALEVKTDLQTSSELGSKLISNTNIPPSKEVKTNPEIVEQLSRITTAHLTFCKRVTSLNILDKALTSPQQIELFFKEFNRFLNLGYTWRKDNFCPTLIIDLIWHSAMMYPDRYALLCESFFGKKGFCLPHCLTENESKEKQLARSAEFNKYYIHRFCQGPLIPSSTRVESLTMNSTKVESLVPSPTNGNSPTKEESLTPNPTNGESLLPSSTNRESPASNPTNGESLTFNPTKEEPVTLHVMSEEKVKGIKSGKEDQPRKGRRKTNKNSPQQEELPVAKEENPPQEENFVLVESSPQDEKVLSETKLVYRPSTEILAMAEQSFVNLTNFYKELQLKLEEQERLRREAEKIQQEKDRIAREEEKKRNDAAWTAWSAKQDKKQALRRARIAAGLELPSPIRSSGSC
jgi:hypothetical protein